MPNIAFKITGEAGQFIRENERVIVAQKRAEQQFGQTAIAAESSSRRIERAAGDAAGAYDLATPQASGSVRAVAGRSRISRARVLPLAPVGRSSIASQIATASGGVYDLRHEVSAREDQSLRKTFESERLRYLGTRSLTQRLDREAREAKWLREGQFQAELAGIDYERKERERGDRSERWRQRRQRFGQLVAMGATAGVYGGYRLLQEQTERVHELGERATAFHDQMTPLYGVGQNTSRRAELRKEVLDQSMGWGIDTGQIAGMKARMASAFSDLPDDVQRAAELAALKQHKLIGADLTQTALALGAAFQLVGDEVAGGAEGMRELENKLTYAADVGAFDVDKFTPYLAMVLASFKGMGYTHEEALAASAVASKSGMREEAWATGVRNLPLLMSEAQKKLGRPLSKDFTAAMGELAGMESEDLLALVGRDPFVVAKLLSQKQGLLGEYTGQMRGITGKQDVSGAKLAEAWRDQPSALVETIKSFKQVQDNADLIKTQDPRLGEEIEEYEAIRAGAKMIARPSDPEWLTKFDGFLAYVSGGASSRNRTLRTVGERSAINAALAGGEPLKADMLALRAGERQGMSYKRATTMDEFRATGNRYVQQFTGATETNEYAGLFKDYDLNAAEYLNWKTMSSVRPQDAWKVLAANRRPATTAREGSKLVAKYFNDAISSKPAQATGSALGAMGERVGAVGAGALNLFGLRMPGLDEIKAFVDNKVEAVRGGGSKEMGGAATKLREAAALIEAAIAVQADSGPKQLHDNPINGPQ